MAIIPNTNLFAAFASDIANWKGGAFLNGTMLDRLTLAREGSLSIIYAPFDYIQPAAKLVIVGITPGRVQAENALLSAQRALRSGKGISDAMRIAKSDGSFSGPLRQNLVHMLDHIGLNRKFRLPSCDGLFTSGSTDVHFTSALRYPVFVSEKNYCGQPDMIANPMLRQVVETYLRAEAEQLPNAIWLPLGPKPMAAIDHLVRNGVIDRNRVLANLPHPSGANGERISYFMGRKKRSELSSKTRSESLDAAREKLIAQVTGMMEAR